MAARKPDKTATLVQQCLDAPAYNLIAAPPAPVLAMEKTFIKLEPSARAQVVEKVAQWYGPIFPWPELTAEEAASFARTQTTLPALSPGTRAFLFGSPSAQTPGDLDTFNRCLRIAAAEFTLQQNRNRTKWLAAIPTMDPGAEEPRILALFLDVARTEAPLPFLRKCALTFAMKNERWHLFDALEQGFAEARGQLEEYDLLLRSLFPSHGERLLALHERLYAANERGQAFMKPVWEAERELEAATFDHFTKHPAVVKALGKSLWLGGHAGGNRDATALRLQWPVSRQTGKREALGKLTAHATRAPKGWRYDVLRFEGGGKVLDLA